MAAGPDPDAPRDPGEQGLAEVADALLREAQELKRQWAQLHRALGGELPSRERTRPRAAGDEASGEASDPRRLIALEMLLAGRSREDVEAYLSAEFGPDAPAVLEEIFGGS